MTLGALLWFMLLTVWWMLCCRDTIFPSITRLGSSVRICRGLLTKAAPLLHVEFQALPHPTVSPLCSWPENRLPLTSHCSKTPARRQQQSPPPPPDLGCFLLLRGFGWTSAIQGFSQGEKKKKKIKNMKFGRSFFLPHQGLACWQGLLSDGCLWCTSQ